jgi:hypothetical protein
MGNQVALLGPLVQELAALGGMFGWADSVDLAFHLANAIAHARGQTFGETRTEGIKDAIDMLALLAIPPHPVTRLPDGRMPTWDHEAKP